MLDAILSDWTPDEREDFLRALTRFNDTVDGWIVRDEIPHGARAGDAGPGTPG